MNSDPYPFETGIYRPPSEGGSASLLVRLTRNCPWNHCTFCAMYKGKKFQLRPLDEIRADIQAMAALARDLETESQALGHGGRITHEAVMALVRKVPALNHHQGAAMLIQWLAAGGKTVFLQDGNSLIMKTPDLVQALTALKEAFPGIQRITTYARSRTLAQKSPDSLKAIQKAGLNRVHIGMESGYGALLKQIKKGVDPEGHVQGGQKAMAAGFQVSEYWMPGLGGRQMSQDHARHTAQVLNQINPHYIRSRPFRPIAGTPLSERVRQGEVTLLTPEEQLLEIQTMIQELEVTSKVCFDHAGNFWRTGSGELVFTHDYEGYQFPQEKGRVLERIEKGLAAARNESLPLGRFLS